MLPIHAIRQLQIVLTSLSFFLYVPQVYGGDCSSKLVGIPEARLARLQKSGKFDQTRSFSEYLELLPSEFEEHVRTAQLWIDAGGGLGAAQTEAHEYHPYMDTINITMSKIKKTNIVYRHKDKSGKLLEDFAETEFSHVNIITDVFGAFVYSARPDKVLQRFNDWLDPSGRAYIFWDSFVSKHGTRQNSDSKLDQSTVISEGREIPLLQWVVERSGMNCKLSQKESILWRSRAWHSKSLICIKTPGIKIRSLRIEKTTNDLPPVRVFRECIHM